jgi:hypothetical protein
MSHLTVRLSRDLCFPRTHRATMLSAGENTFGRSLQMRICEAFFDQQS